MATATRNREETICNVHWEGPFGFGEVLANRSSSTGEPLIREGHVLYQLYGTHLSYGPHRLLYIGKTLQGQERFEQHSHWVELQPEPMTVRLASVARFNSWAEWRRDKRETYPRPAAHEEDLLINQVERLLIYAHSPAYNSSSIASLGRTSGIRIFNTGTYGQLLPELSSFYMGGDDA